MGKAMSAKILIVDDDPNLLKLVGFALYRAGYQALSALGGEEAMRLVQEETPDLVILDIMMPGMNGLDVLRELRARPVTAGLPVIILSARTQVAARIEGLEAGADEYVDKPVSPKELVARVAALLERTRRVQEAATSRLGPVFSCIGAKGGVGTTTIAINLALALAAEERKVVAVELQSGPGTMAYQLHPEPAHTVADLLAKEPEEIDEAVLDQMLISCPGGLRALPASPDTYGTVPVTVDHARSIIHGLANLADYTIVDLAARPAPATRTALRQSDMILLVCEPDTASVAAANVLLQLLLEWGVDRAATGVVLVHHAENPAALSRRQVEAELAHWTLAEIPAAPALFANALKESQTFLTHSPESTVARALKELATALVPTT
jgi:DNA-binding response OmpR family regulator